MGKFWFFLFLCASFCFFSCSLSFYSFFSSLFFPTESYFGIACCFLPFFFLSILSFLPSSFLPSPTLRLLVGPPEGNGPIDCPRYVCMYVCLYVCMYVCHEIRLCWFSQNLALRFFFILCTTKEGINTYQMVKTPFRLMYLVMGFGPFLGPNFPKNEHSVILLENGAYDFF